VTPDDQVSSPFIVYYEKCYAPLYFDKSLNISFRHCDYPYCTHNRGLAIAFHAECVYMAAPFGTPLHEYRLITEHSYRHVALNHERRRSRVRELIEDALRKAYGKLSPELWHIVSDDDKLIRLYTIAEISLHHRQTEWFVNPSLAMLSTTVSMDGVQYVGSLTNSSGIVSRQATTLIPSSEFKNLYVENDHMGIRLITSEPNEVSLDTIYPAYWQTVSTDKQTLTFRGDVSPQDHSVYQMLTSYSQGLKLRELLTPSVYPRVFWPHPVTPSELDSMTFYYAGWGEGDLEARLRTLTFNEPGTIGYSVCWANDEMVSVHVHRNVEQADADGSLLDEHSEYEDRSHLKWTYYPIQEDESIQEVWLRGSEKYDTTRPLPSQGEGGLRYHLSTPWGLQKYKRLSDIAFGVRLFAGF
jgi:hypothetical protein